MITKLLAGLTAALALAVLVQSCRLSSTGDQLDTANANLAVCRSVNAQNDLDIEAANKASSQCREDLAEQRRRGVALAALAEVEREERENALRDRIRRMRAALDDALEGGDLCLDVPIPDDADRMLREGAPGPDRAGDGRGDSDGGSAGGVD